VIQALAAIGAGTTVTLIALTAWLTYRLVGAMREQLAARDMLDAEREQHRVTRGERDTETAAHAVTRDELRKEKDLRASAESERNQALQEGANHVVERIKTANIADANRLLAGLLADPLAGFVPQAVPEGGTAASDRDGLLNPFVQPPSDP
jgi:hypothetical protein